jgi:hypothetical protein
MRNCSCGGAAKFKAADPRSVLSVVGHVDYPRRRYHCPACRSSQIPLDVWAGVGDRSITWGARRMIALAGTSWSFDRASSNLREFCHLNVSDDTIERVCQEEGSRAQQWISNDPAPAKRIRSAVGEVELSSDGTCVNTVDGWREMRLSTVLKRKPTASVDAGRWNDRVLNAPTARLSICVIADANHVGARWQRLSRQLDLRREPIVHAIADGAKWIWDQFARRLPRHNGSWCVDVYHVSQHLHQCGRELLGEGTAARAWAEDHLKTALESNGPALIERLESEQSACVSEPARRQAIEKLLTYLRPNRDRMWYADRLRQGRTIGSGQIEGGCKNTIGARLKLNSARWRIRRAERIGTLRCIESSNLWQEFWSQAA